MVSQPRWCCRDGPKGGCARKLLAKGEHQWQKGVSAEKAEAPGKNYAGFQV
jgi:hypothetical protein